jgi:hypothetical protein
MHDGVFVALFMLVPCTSPFIFLQRVKEKGE